MGDVIGISFESMAQEKIKLTRARDLSQQIMNNFNAAITALDNGTSFRVRLAAADIREEVNKVSKRIEDIDRVNAGIDYAVRRFQEVDDNIASKIKGTVEEYRIQNNQLTLGENTINVNALGGFQLLNNINLLKMNDYEKLQGKVIENASENILDAAKKITVDTYNLIDNDMKNSDDNYDMLNKQLGIDNEGVRKAEGIFNGFGKFGWGTIKGAGFIGKTVYDFAKSDGAVIGNKLGMVSNTTLDKSMDSANNNLNTWKQVPRGIINGVANIMKSTPRLFTDRNMSIKDVSNLTNDIINTGFIAKGSYDVTNKVGVVAKTVIPKVYSSMNAASVASRTMGLRPSIAGFGNIGGVVSPLDSIMVYIKTINKEMGNGATAKSDISGARIETEIPKIDKVGGEEVTSRGSKEGPYSHLEDIESVGAGKNFTPVQKTKILQVNREINGGVVKSDLSGQELVKPRKSQKGITPSQNEWQIDHIEPRDLGGSNSYSNAQVLSRKENRDKWDK